jgi:hypothetical protein
VSDDEDFDISSDKEDSENIPALRPRRVLRRGTGTRRVQSSEEEFGDEVMDISEDSDMVDVSNCSENDDKESDFSGIKTRRAKDQGKNNKKGSKCK